MKHMLAVFAAAVLNCHAGLSDLEALSLIESGDNDRAIGEAGEVSRYQILPKVWRTYTQSRDYRSRWTAGEVARRHMATLKSSFLSETGRSPADFEVYVMWNAGLNYYRRAAFNPRRVHAVIRERAERYVNLRHYASSGNVQVSLLTFPPQPAAQAIPPAVQYAYAGAPVWGGAR